MVETAGPARCANEAKISYIHVVYWSIDFDPGEIGKKGQIIAHGIIDEENYVLADSFEEFMLWYLSQLESGNFFIGEDSAIYDEPRTAFRIAKDTAFSEVVGDYFKK